MENINRVNDLKAAVASYNQLFINQDPITVLKRGQIDSLYSMKDGKDTFIVLPTGYGKSLIFELVPFYVSKRVIVLEPLNSIIHQLEQKLEGHVVRIDKDTDYDRLQHIKFIIGHPEDIINPHFYHQVSTLPWVQDNIVIVVDEAHLILQWQDDFRPVYKKIKHLRAIFRSITMCAMTATVSRESIKAIRRDLQMLRGNVIDSIPLLRDNISLNVRRRPGYRQDSTPLAPYEDVFKPIIEECLVKGEHAPLTIVYTKLIWCVKGVELAKTIMGDQFYDGEATNKNAKIVQFHSPQDEEVNLYILKSLEKPDSHIKIIFATIALGMGADLKHVRRVVHAGPPSSIEDYIQEIGRAGRTGQIAESTIFFNGTDTSSKILQKAMKTYLTQDEECRRMFLAEYFGCRYECLDSTDFVCCDKCSNDQQLTVPAGSNQIHQYLVSLALREYVSADESGDIFFHLTDVMISRISETYGTIEPSSISAHYNLPEYIGLSIQHIISAVTEV